ncbi:hypothetical protein, partial [Escherichia coli]|uniref:hypothetical protein n=1 Tax=Escherichia coli TaxID=562 RepID=UPI002283C6B9
MNETTMRLGTIKRTEEEDNGGRAGPRRADQKSIVGPAKPAGERRCLPRPLGGQRRDAHDHRHRLLHAFQRHE